MTPPGFKANGPTGGTFTTSASVGVTLPASATDNDICIMVIVINDANPVITWPAGWAQIVSESQTADFHYGAAWKRVTTAEAGTIVEPSFSDPSTGTTRTSVFSGITLHSIVLEESAISKGTSTAASAPAMTTVGYDRLGVALYGIRRNVATTPPAGWTENQDAGAVNARYCMETKIISSPSTEDIVFDRAFTDADWIVCRFAFKPISDAARSFAITV